MSRLASDVIQTLLDEMQLLVRSYGKLRRTGEALPTLIQGTAFFPGGSGLWRGAQCHGPLPELFPETPVMFVAHNFDSETAYITSRDRGGEVESSLFWKRFLKILEGAGVDMSDCFFTNALMGLKPGSAVGTMPATRDFRQECRQFLLRQYEIVAPRAIVALGGTSKIFVRSTAPAGKWIPLTHPSAREFNAVATRDARLDAQAAVLREFLAGLAK